MRCNDMPPFSSSMGERKIVNHFVVTKSTRQCHSPYGLKSQK
jgi:hypothetical protein